MERAAIPLRLAATLHYVGKKREASGHGSGKGRDAAMREIPWPCAGIFPYIAAHGTQTVLPRKEIIFAAEQLVIFIENMQGGVKHTGLSEKQSLQLHLDRHNDGQET